MQRLDLTKVSGFGPILERMLKSRRFQFYFILPNSNNLLAGCHFGHLWDIRASTKLRNCHYLVHLVCPDVPGDTAYWPGLVSGLSLRRSWANGCSAALSGNEHKRNWDLGLKMPQALAEYGLLMSVGVFIILSWLEEFFNIAGPGAPYFDQYHGFGNYCLRFNHLPCF